MACNRIVGLVLAQALLFGCGGGLILAIHARLAATALVLVMVALWILVGVVSRFRSRVPVAIERQPPRTDNDGARARLLASLLDQTPTPLVSRDAQGAFLACNRAARQLFRTDGPLIPPPPCLAEAMGPGGVIGRARISVVKEKAVRSYALLLSDVTAAEGPLRLAALLDIEPEVRAAEANASRELMQVLSHEIMNGLTPVASLAATARELLDTDDVEAKAQACEALEVLARRADGLVRFAEGYRALARLPPPVRVQTSLSGLIAEAARLFRSRWPDVTLSVRTPSPDIRLALDSDQVMQALLNLMANGAQAAVTHTVAPEVQLEVLPVPDGGAVIRVVDNGAGIPEAVQEHIGKPFFTTKTEGTGVGLSVARQVARAHGGTLELCPSALDSGAVFELRVSG